MDLGLQHKRALVLASTSGLGFATALGLAGEGARVAICGRDRQRVTDAAGRIQEQAGATVESFVADVSDAQALERLVKDATEALGGLDILVCNAGGPPPGNFEALGEEQWDRAYQLTLQSVIRSIRLALPHLRKAGGGSILCLASSSVREPIANLVLSNVFRPAVRALCKSLANELAADRIRVNCLSPGRIMTDRIRQLDQARADREGRGIEEVQADSVKSIPLGRVGDPAEFGRVATFLCSEAASYMTGSSVFVDGGMLRSL